MNNPNDPFAVPPEGAPIPGQPAPAPAAAHPAASPQPPQAPPPFAGPAPQPPYGGPSHQPYAGPPSQPPYGGPPQPPYGAPRKGNLGLLIGIIIAAILLVVGIGAALYFTGVIGNRDNRPAPSESELVPLTAQNLTGIWAVGECANYTYEYRADGTFLTHELGSNRFNRQGSWRIQGDSIYITREGPWAPTDGSSPTYSRRVENLTATGHEQFQASGDSAYYMRCPPTAKGSLPSSLDAPSSAAGSAPSATGGNIAAGLQQAAAQLQSRLPMQNGPVRITQVNAQGTTMRMYGTIARAMTPADWSRMDATLRPNICNSGSGAVVRAGATVELIMSDSTMGAPHTLSVSSC